MKTQIVNGNEALAFGALHAGVHVVTGYPGTPSTRALASLLSMKLPDRYVEWSTNEKVALEIASAAAWAGKRALCTMKMSGLNVAYDSLISIAYSGVIGGLVIYVADDPGVNAGMAEQDSRGFALMSDLPMLEPTTVAETYQFIQTAFDLSESIGSPVFIRLTTALANSKTAIQIEAPVPPLEKPALLIRDIAKFTKAGSAICLAQHQDLINRLKKAEDWLDSHKTHTIHQPEPSHTAPLGIITGGFTSAYLQESLELCASLGIDTQSFNILNLKATNPLPTRLITEMLQTSQTILVIEELEPYIENFVYILAQKLGISKRIIGKQDGQFLRVGEYGIKQIVTGIATAFDKEIPEEILNGLASEKLAAQRPITVCAGCPHRGTYLAINAALKKLRYKKDEVMVTGDIGCTILGMNPPFNTVWNEVSMGASIGMAQGYVLAGTQTPVIATMGDSTFFHAGLNGLVNAIQHQTPLTLIIMDNGWTAMTGMQVNPGTSTCFQAESSQTIDIAKIIPALGVDQFFIMDPFDMEQATETVKNAIQLPGVKVILSRQECAIQVGRRGEERGKAVVDLQKCVVCKLCINITGCPALSIEEDKFMIDEALCNGCGLCAAVCNLDAIQIEVAE